MKKLLLLRHAKSSWDQTGLSDFERPLNQRGEGAAPLIGKAMRQKHLDPNLILSSPAVRARETTRLVIESARLKGSIKYEPGIYEAGAGQLLEIISRVDAAAELLMIVGHNPGFENLVTVLTGEAPRLPTAALACINLEIAQWSAIAPQSGTLDWVLKPKDLK